MVHDWDVDGDGTFDAQGQTVQHSYDEEGTYEATLRVTDDEGLQGTDTVTVTVTAEAAADPSAPLPTTGGGAALLGFLAMAGAGALALRRRGRS